MNHARRPILSDRFTQTTHHRMHYALACLLILCTALGGCAMSRPPPAPTTVQAPALHPDHAVMDDGYVLPLAVWRPVAEPRAVVLALHGFNDYRNAFATVGPALAARGMLTYAYDQRGFGETARRGLWPGTPRLIEDLQAMVGLLRARHPERPLYLLGESMGGAVLLAAVGQGPVPADGLILLAPAVWSRATMPPLQRFALWLGGHLLPGREVSPEGLEITASDNTAMLEALGDDPLIIKRSRIDTLRGLADLMDQAQAGVPALAQPALILYGERDEIIPRWPTCRLLARLPRAAHRHWRAALYPDGYHMLTRDLQAEVVLGDITAWIADPAAPLPSGLEWTAIGAGLPALCAE